ncbi:hypothetical protein [Clavavirus yamagawaense]|uniref:Uncharacterized protein n=1 Tax=Aeropyrum pernix bacilliform virus 1 (isolate -/Japan/Tanaka/2005) TaxID=1289471 RepID=D4QF68_APBV1|nr:hypothetical protein FK791_gp02 [Aeropyrum pernix bacilliform virus 1]BAJ06112.1 hypothetical protein [Aeropyrum pernix bacilliform virus 1]
MKSWVKCVGPRGEELYLWIWQTWEDYHSLRMLHRLEGEVCFEVQDPNHKGGPKREDTHKGGLGHSKQNTQSIYKRGGPREGPESA